MTGRSAGLTQIASALLPIIMVRLRAAVPYSWGAAYGGIAYTATENADTNGFNENLTVEADEQTLYLRSMGMAHFGQNRDQKLTFEGAAETYWQMFVQR